MFVGDVITFQGKNQENKDLWSVPDQVQHLYKNVKNYLNQKPLNEYVPNPFVARKVINLSNDYSILLASGVYDVYTNIKFIFSTEKLGTTCKLKKFRPNFNNIFLDQIKNYPCKS